MSRSLKFIWFKIRHFHYFLWNHSGVVRKYITKVFLRYVTFLLLKRDFFQELAENVPGRRVSVFRASAVCLLPPLRDLHAKLSKC